VFTTRYGLSTRRTAERYVCLEGSGGFVTSTAAPIAYVWGELAKTDGRRARKPLVFQPPRAGRPPTDPKSV